MISFQLALAAVLHSASKEQENLDSYVTECLFENATDKLPVLIEAVRSKDCYSAQRGDNLLNLFIP